MFLCVEGGGNVCVCGIEIRCYCCFQLVWLGNRKQMLVLFSVRVAVWERAVHSVYCACLSDVGFDYINSRPLPLIFLSLL